MPGRERVLILGGTADARALASLLVGKGHWVETSLAGVTSDPVLPVGHVRRGGFGGVEGLAAYLRQGAFTVLVDATHPFAATMSSHAVAAAAQIGLPVLRLERPAWTSQAGDHWISVASMEEAATALPLQARVLVTSGRKGLEPLLARADLSGLIRTIDPPAQPLPPRWTLLQERPPFSLSDELHLLQHHDVTHLLTKNAGGASTQAKLEAARTKGIPVMMLVRPAKPACTTHADAQSLALALG